MKAESTGSAVGTTGAEGAASTALIGLTCGAVSVVAGLLQIIDTYYAAHPPIWLVLLAILAWMTWVAMMSRQLVQRACVEIDIFERRRRRHRRSRSRMSISIRLPYLHRACGGCQFARRSLVKERIVVAMSMLRFRSHSL